MNEILIIEAVEKYIRGEMNPDEKQHFESLRKSSPEVDQLVVEHTLFLQQMDRFDSRHQLKTTLHDVHINLDEAGEIDSPVLKGKAKIVYLWNRYKRVAAIAASIAGITAITISFLIWAVSPKNGTAGEMEKLKGAIINMQDKTTKEISNIKAKLNDNNTRKEAPLPFNTGAGTAFVIDVKGYLVTNAHVVENAKDVAIQNEKGEYLAHVVYTDVEKDIAILKIDDEDFKPFSNIPYSISRNSADLAEPIFTLGYPRKEIVYGQGYLSAKTGFNGDTLSCQIEINANHGNSGSPILNRNGEVIGILNGRQANTEGVTFAIQSKNIYRALDELKKDTSYQKVKLSNRSSLSGMDRTQQVQKVTDYVFMVKVK